jgi:amphi-Trp domain-containing protein
MADRDIERNYTVPEFAAKLRRLADALESGKPFRIQIAGERFTVPRNAEISVEHERDDDAEEVEFQLKWKLADVEEPEHDADV